MILHSLPSSGIIKEVLLSFLKDTHGPGERFDPTVMIDDFLDLEFRAFEVISEKINLICSIYKDYVMKIIDFKTESMNFY